MRERSPGTLDRKDAAITGDSDLFGGGERAEFVYGVECHEVTAVDANGHVAGARRFITIDAGCAIDKPSAVETVTIRNMVAIHHSSQSLAMR